MKSRFARTMGTLLHNGVAMLRATDIAVGTVGNGIVRASLGDMPNCHQAGGRLSQALDARVFSPVALQMVRVGEVSLDKMLLELAHNLRGRSRRRGEALTLLGLL